MAKSASEKPSESSPAPAPKPTPQEAANAAYLDDEFGESPEPTPAPKSASTAAAAGQVIAPSPPSGAEKPVAAADPPHLSVYRQLAKREGYEDDEVAAMTADELYRVARMASRKAASDAKPSTRQSESVAPVSVAKPEPQSEPEIDLGWGEEEVDGVLTKLSDKNYDPGLVRVLKNIVKENRELRNIVQGIGGHLHAQEQNKVFDEIDTLFSQRPELFGSGSRSDIESGSPEHAKRVAVVRLMDELAKTHKELGVKSTFKQRHAQAVHALFGGSAENLASVEVGAPNSAVPQKASRERDPETGHFLTDAQIERRLRQEAWVRGGVAQPTQREPDELPPGDRKARRGIAKHLAANGHVDTIPDDEYDDDADV